MKKITQRIAMTAGLISTFCFVLGVSAKSAISSYGRFEYNPDSGKENGIILDAADMEKIYNAVDSNNKSKNSLDTQYDEINNTISNADSQLDSNTANRKLLIDSLNNTTLFAQIPYSSETSEITNNILGLSVPDVAKNAIATSDNISNVLSGYITGSGWITGNGADAKAAYDAGYKAGLAQTKEPTYNMTYTYHKHTVPTDGTVSNSLCNISGGCYTTAKVHQHTGPGAYGKWTMGYIGPVGTTQSSMNGCYRITNQQITTDSRDAYFVRNESSDGYWCWYHCDLTNSTFVGGGTCNHYHIYESSTLACGKTAGAVEGYSLSCGKVEGQSVDKVTITTK